MLSRAYEDALLLCEQLETCLLACGAGWKAGAWTRVPLDAHPAQLLVLTLPLVPLLLCRYSPCTLLLAPARLRLAGPVGLLPLLSLACSRLVCCSSARQC
jgi:hypothetical protein